jgi:hypothetical protein
MASSGKPRATPGEPRRCVGTTREGGQCKSTRIDLACSRRMCRKHCNAAGPCKLARHVLRTPQCQTASLSLPRHSLANSPPTPGTSRSTTSLQTSHVLRDSLVRGSAAVVARQWRLQTRRGRTLSQDALVCTLFILAGIAPSHHKRLKLRC